jgi:hypothetical protein
MWINCGKPLGFVAAFPKTPKMIIAPPIIAQRTSAARRL